MGSTNDWSVSVSELSQPFSFLLKLWKNTQQTKIGRDQAATVDKSHAIQPKQTLARAISLTIYTAE